RATIWSHAYRRAVFTPPLIFFVVRGPPSAISVSVRHTVGTDATRPNSSPRSPTPPTSLIAPPPPAIPPPPTPPPPAPRPPPPPPARVMPRHPWAGQRL